MGTLWTIVWGAPCFFARPFNSRFNAFRANFADDKLFGGGIISPSEPAEGERHREPPGEEMEDAPMDDIDDDDNR